jgi:cholesterol transport system auxiliary component
MKTMNKKAVVRVCRLFAAGLALLALGACSLLSPKATPASAFYSLDGARNSAAAPATAAAQAPAKTSAPTLIVSPPLAAAGFDSPRIIYVREPHKLEYFAHSEWVDPPARMLAPLLVAAIEHTSAFGAVVMTPGAAAGDLRLDTEIIRLQQEFLSQPSRVRFTLRAVLVNDRTRRVVATREFDGTAAAPSDDPYGGVVAANLVVQTVLQDLTAFCVEAARSVPMESSAAPK